MAILVDSEIRILVDKDNLIDGFDESSIQGASYDMRLGSQYVKRGEVKTLTNDLPTIILEPGEFSVFTSFESLKLPLNMIGHVGLMSNWARRGIVSLFSPQIDPGYWGILFVPVFNAGDASISFTLSEKIFTVEFDTTTSPATYGWSDRHGKQIRISSLNTPFVSRPNLADVSKITEKTAHLEETSKTAQNEILLLKTELQARPSMNDILRIVEKIEHIEENMRMIQIEMMTYKAEFQHKVTENYTQLNSNLSILENRISDLLTAKQLRWVWIGLIIALLSLLIAFLSTPWLHTFFHF